MTTLTSPATTAALCGSSPVVTGHETAVRIDYEAVFQASLTAQAVLTTSFHFVSVNHAFARQAGRPARSLLGRSVFEMFPGNPVEDDGAANLRASLQRVIDTEEPDRMPIQRYDIAPTAGSNAADPEILEERYWNPVNTPVLAQDGSVTGILHRVEDITEHRAELLTAMKWFRSVVDQSNDPECDHTFIEFMTTVLTDSSSLADAQEEVQQLKEALLSRAEIDQAKGILMATHRVDARAAFKILAELSNNGNVKLRDVVSAILYKTVLP